MARPPTSTEDRPASKDLRPLLQAIAFLKPYKTRIVLALAALTIAALCMIALGQALKQVIDEGFATRDSSALDRTFYALMAVVSVLAASVYVRFYNVSWLGERVTADIRRAVFSHLLRLEPSFYETTRTGEVISRLTNDTTLLETVIGSSLSMALRNGVIMIGSIIMLAVTSAKLTALVLIGVPVVMAPILIFGRRVRRLSRDTQDRVADVAAYVDETLHEIRTVQAYVHESHDRARFGDRVEATFGTALRRIDNRAWLVALAMFLTLGSVGVILWIGGHDVLAGRISAGELSAFVFYAVLIAGAVGAISEVYGDLQRAAGATERLMTLLHATPQVRAPAQPRAMPATRHGSLAFERVQFSYPSRPEPAALAEVSFQVTAGERVAVVGPSGAGKSTVFQLLLRFYDPQAGRVIVDGIDVREVDPTQLRQRFALVPQEPVVFAASIAENVRYARPEASDDEVRDACAAAFMLEFIERLPERFATQLGERGVRLSGGERQRLAIARALLADRPILLLDEATSSLDAQSEAYVQQALDRLMRDRTTLVIAHRLATVRDADRILVMETGRIVAQGRHDELVRQGGLYSRLAALQFVQ